jgi:fumarate hydratase class II
LLIWIELAVLLAAAKANFDVGAMKNEQLVAIEKACQAVIDGKYQDQLVVDWYQGGAGTSTNMNVNEVLAATWDQQGFVASAGLNPQKARVLLRLALLKTRSLADFQRLSLEC